MTIISQNPIAQASNTTATTTTKGKNQMATQKQIEQFLATVISGTVSTNMTLDKINATLTYGSSEIQIKAKNIQISATPMTTKVHETDPNLTQAESKNSTQNFDDDLFSIPTEMSETIDGALMIAQASNTTTTTSTTQENNQMATQKPIEKFLATEQPKDLWDLLNHHAPTDFFPDGEISYDEFERVGILMIEKILSVLDPQKNLELEGRGFCYLLPTNLVIPEKYLDFCLGHFYNDMIVVSLEFGLIGSETDKSYRAQEYIDVVQAWGPNDGGPNHDDRNPNPLRFFAECVEYFQNNRTNWQEDRGWGLKGENWPE